MKTTHAYGKWSVEAELTNHGTLQGKIKLFYEGRTIWKENISYFPAYGGMGPEGTSDGTLIPNEAKMAFFTAMASNYHERGWEPSYKAQLMSAARILCDALDEVNGREITAITPRGKLTCLTVHPGAFYWLTEDLRLSSYNIPEIGRQEANEDDQEAFSRLVDQEKLREAVLEKLKEIYEPNPDYRNTKLTQKEKKLAELEAKLAAWKENKPIAKENP